MVCKRWAGSFFHRMIAFVKTTFKILGISVVVLAIVIVSYQFVGQGYQGRMA